MWPTFAQNAVIWLSHRSAGLDHGAYRAHDVGVELSSAQLNGMLAGAVLLAVLLMA